MRETALRLTSRRPFAGMPGAQATARQGWRDRNGRCKPGGLASGMDARQGGDSFAGSVHDSPPRQGDARGSHKQEKNRKNRKKNRKNNNSNKHSNHRNITSGKNIPDTSQTGRVTGDASAWPASLPAGVSLPGVFARTDRRPPPPAPVSPVSATL